MKVWACTWQTIFQWKGVPLEHMKTYGPVYGYLTALAVAILWVM